MKKTIYLFSGLGADERIFQKLDLSSYDPVFIQWIAPQPQESIVQYAHRLLAQITTVNPILIGISFGGMMAIEVAKYIETDRVILISSAKNQSEIPFYYRWAGALGLHRLLHPTFLKRTHLFTQWIFGTESDQERQLLQQIIADTDPLFLTWAIDQIVHWKNKTIPAHLFQIHGCSDKILPSLFITQATKISKGGHLMIFNKPIIIDDFITQACAT